jgi:cold shock CspA family protein
METGTVEWFNAQKLFGYIVLQDKTKIWFHLNDGRPLAINKIKKIVKFGEFPQRNGIPAQRLRMPLQGEDVVFERSNNLQGPKASPWGYKTTYDKGLEMVKNLPEPTVYRVMELMKVTGKEPGEPEVRWTGNDIRELPNEFSRPSHGQSPTSDPFVPYGDPDGNFSVERWFEKKVDADFVRCGDPRPR